MSQALGPEQLGPYVNEAYSFLGSFLTQSYIPLTPPSSSKTRAMRSLESRLRTFGAPFLRPGPPEHQERARRAAVLEPPMLGAVDLHELADAVPAIARLVHGLEPLLAVAPEAVSQHPLPKRLAPEMEAVSLGQLLASEGRTEVGVVGLDQPQRLRSERRRIAAVAGLAAAR